VNHQVDVHLAGRSRDLCARKAPPSAFVGPGSHLPVTHMIYPQRAKCQEGWGSPATHGNIVNRDSHKAA
jgi:hypothetical protein